MDGLLNGALYGGVIGGVTAGLVVGLMALFQKPKTCPECDAPQPKSRMPKNRRQFLRGGWTCENYGCEIDRKGKKGEG